MSIYEVGIQTDEVLINKSIEFDNNQELGEYVKQALTEGLSLVATNGKSGSFIPAHEIKKIKWRNSNSTPRSGAKNSPHGA